MASVSIRSGSGSGTHDRVLRFTQPFVRQDEAEAYARSQGLAWLGRNFNVAAHQRAC